MLFPLSCLASMPLPSLTAAGVVLSGHSLGAAQSNIGAFELGMGGFPVTQVVSSRGVPGACISRRRQPATCGGARHQQRVCSSEGLGLVADIHEHSLRTAPAPSLAISLTHYSSPSHTTLQINFGQPRIGEGNYSAAFEALVVHGQDNATAPAAPALDVAALHERDATKVLLSATALRAIERALGHDDNAHLTVGRASVASHADAEELLAALRDHARKSLSFVRKQAASRNRLRSMHASWTLDAADRARIQAAARAEAVAALRAEESETGGELRPALTKPQRALLAGLRFPLAAPAFPGAQVFRLIHNADIVPHLVSLSQTRLASTVYCSADISMLLLLLLRLRASVAASVAASCTPPRALSWRHSRVHPCDHAPFNLNPCSRQPCWATATAWKRCGITRPAPITPPAPP